VDAAFVLLHDFELGKIIHLGIFALCMYELS
jgi:hypothetical protein